MKKPSNVAIFTRRLGKQSETFVRQNIEGLNGGKTVVVCRYLINDPFSWISKSRALVLSNYPRWSWFFVIAWFCRKHRVQYAVVEFLDWACDMQTYIKLMGMPYVALGHGFDVSRHIKSKEYYSKQLNDLSTASAILVPSQFLKSLLVESTNLRPDLIKVLPCGVDLDRFSMSSKVKRGRLVFIGRFVEKKSPLLLLKSFKYALESGADLELRLGGDGPLLEEAKAFVLREKLFDKVTFLGALSHDQVHDELHSAMALVQHSVTGETGDTEGLPVIIQEALAVGLPVLSTYHAGIPEIIDDGVTGYLVAEKDTQGMAKAMIEVSQLTEEKYEKMRKACRSQAEALLSRERRIDWINEIIDGLKVKN